MNTYKTSGVCSRSITFDVSADGLVRDVRFEGGCHGNLQGLSRMVEGCPISEVVERLAGIRCESKQTSCPDQLARSLSDYMQKNGISANEPVRKNGGNNRPAAS